MKIKLRTAPYFIDPDAIAEGMLDLFTEEEKTILRFGMLPAEKMGVLEKLLREKFTLGNDVGDDVSAWCVGGKVVEFSMKKLVAEAAHEICVALYKIGDLVV